jgi:fatty acid desaturase
MCKNNLATNDSANVNKNPEGESLKQNSDRKFFEYSLAAAVFFYLFVAYVYLAQGGLLYFFFVFPLAVIATGAVIIVFIISPPNRLKKLLYVAGGATFFVVVFSVLPLFHGYPVSNYVTSYNCFTTPVVNATYPSYTYTTTVCPSSTSTFSLSNALWDLFFWLGISGLVSFAVFSWTNKEKSVYYKVGRSLVAAILLTALTLLVLGVPTPPL